MKIEAKTIDEFFEKSGIHAEAIRQMDEFIQKQLPNLDRKLYNSDTTCVLGYGEIPYKNTTYSGTIPIISIAPQKNTANIYVMARKDDKNLAEIYADKLGTISNGKSCIRFKKFSNLNLDEMKKMLNDIYDVYQSIVNNSESATSKGIDDK